MFHTSCLTPAMAFCSETKVICKHKYPYVSNKACSIIRVYSPVVGQGELLYNGWTNAINTCIARGCLKLFWNLVFFCSSCENTRPCVLFSSPSCAPTSLPPAVLSSDWLRAEAEVPFKVVRFLSGVGGWWLPLMERCQDWMCSINNLMHTKTEM